MPLARASGVELDALGAALDAEPAAAEDVSAFWTLVLPLVKGASSPWEAAVLGAARADRLGYAFVTGYEAALWALLPQRDRSRPAAMCATEQGGAHPRAIATQLRDGVLDGEKVFVTLGEHAEELLVLAKSGERDGRPLLSLVRVQRDAPGVTLTKLPPAPFVPEIPHAAIRFCGVRAIEVLPGDGWSDYVRPFRTIEDIHVHTAFLAWLVALGRRAAFAREGIARACAILCALRALSCADPSSPLTHIALAGSIDATRMLVDALEPEWERVDPSTRERWQRDRALLNVAGKARALRSTRAWERLG